MIFVVKCVRGVYLIARRTTKAGPPSDAPAVEMKWNVRYYSPTLHPEGVNVTILLTS